MINLDGYSGIFKFYKNAAKDTNPAKTYPEFKSHPELFNFILPINKNPDSPSLQQAVSLNPTIAFQMMELGGSRAGGYFGCIDAVECRHILMLTFFKNYLCNKYNHKPTALIGLGKVLEIGGGYGNFIRLSHQQLAWEDWTIIDLEYISHLQEWFLTTEKVSLDQVHFMYEDHLESYEANIVIGTHSLSEFDMDTFILYYEKYVRNAKILLYASHNQFPSAELLKAKQDIIANDFELRTSLVYEGGQSTMYIFEHK